MPIGYPKFGANKGWFKKNIPHNKGAKRTDEQRKNMSIAQKLSYQNGKITWNKGKKGLQIAWNKGKKCDYMIGEKNPRWTGGRFQDSNGYVLVRFIGHPNAIRSNYIYEHRLVMEKHLGRYLKPEEVVDHVNRIKNDNRIENLKLFKNNSEHMKFHWSRFS